jgi:hypothetical protein
MRKAGRENQFSRLLLFHPERRRQPLEKGQRPQKSAEMETDVTAERRQRQRMREAAERE